MSGRNNTINLIKFFPTQRSVQWSMFINKANLFRFSHSKLKTFNAVSGHRSSSQEGKLEGLHATLLILIREQPLIKNAPCS